MEKIRRDYKVKILFWLVLAAAFAVRAYLFSLHPGGLNQDEASIGYDAFAIMRYGIDRAGNSYPVHLVAWGSGQNALYAYLSIPFIALFGLNVFSVRLVNLVFSLLSVAAIYGAAKHIGGTKCALVSEALLAFSPWNIMLSRWGLESNLFPSLFVIGFWLLQKSLKKPAFFYPAAAVFALSLYSYGSAYLAIPLFGLMFGIYAIVKKLLPLKTLLLGAGLFLVLSLPVFTFAAINLFGWQTVKLGAVTIPKMTGTSRLTTVAGTASPKQILTNLFYGIVLQRDSGNYNSFSFYGCIYLLSLPFAAVGIYRLFKSKTHGGALTLFAFISSLSLFAVYPQTNINRVNLVYIPLVILAAVGISAVKNKTAFASLILAYALMFSGFCIKYFGREYKKDISRQFFYSFSDALKKADSISGGKTVNVTANMNMPYIYVLFYNRIPPQEYIDTVQIYDISAEFQHITSFAGYNFDVSGYQKGEAGVYIISDDEYNPKINGEYYKFPNYTVVKISG